MPEFDLTYKNRADKLVKEAKKKACSTKLKPAARAYFTGETAIRIFGASAGTMVSGTVAQACAGALVGAGLVGVGAATFGVGPAIGVVLSYACLKGVAEFNYQRKNNDLKWKVKQQDDDDGDGPYWAINDPSLLCPLIAKVLKKYERVQRAAAQAGAYGTKEHIKSSLRHARTALRGFGKDKGLLKTTKELFPGLTYNDHELSDRLYELRFYGQMLFNYVEWMTDNIVVPKRNEVADACANLYAHVLRQVHVTGVHANCKKCYNMSVDEFSARLEELKPAKENLTADFRGQDPSKFVGDLKADKRLGQGQLASNMGRLQAAGPMRYQVGGRGPLVEREREKTWNDAIASGKFAGAVSASGVVAGVQLLNQEASQLQVSALSAQPVAGSVGAAAAQGAAAAGQNAGAGVVAAELARTVSNRLTKRSVLKPGRLHGAFALLAEGNDAREEAFREFRRLIAKHDVVSRAPRVGEKIAWYFDKVDKIQQDFERGYAPVLARRNNYKLSVFNSCDDAYNLVYNVNYFFRNCEKFIAFLVYLEVILLEIDLLVSKIPKVGIGVGAIIQPGRKTPAKPETVKGFGADWKKERSIVPGR